MKLGKAWTVKAVGIVLGGAVATGALPTEAKACGGAWYPMMEEDDGRDHRETGVPMAEKKLEDGKLLAAAGIVIRQMPHVRQLAPKSHKLVERAQRVLALAVVRHDGALPIEQEVPQYAQGSWRGKTEKERHENLAWAATVLRSVSELRKDDPASQTDLAEALARIDAHAAEARTLLEKLAGKDLITSPEGYAALAKLRADAGDAKGERVAMQRCEQMARTANICRDATRAAS